ncbi:hypothetical protein CONLIGDRAFT_378966 [Coniochaeta ligniaria NRRL 30616]|uniref:Extracellular membrane protein CFEM domain-containing protein n=1 Tax=Coniochaeta ligniaria NRRL 30616 TaxID=1408157 RepID=A0A1J7IMR2_9PEZI|nr:hypothetical protein CONLIGDRAFT_378966 [Coniochaeta ligniaria NRRL 30616]
MARTVIVALLLAHNVANAIDIPGNFANLALAVTTDPAVTACSIAYEVIDSCYSASPGLSTAANSDVASCLCCYSTVEIDEYYSSCADYISASYPRSTTQYSAFTGLADACATDMPVCGGGAGGGSSPSSTVTSSATNTRVSSATRTTGGGSASGSSATDVPDACTSFQEIISSCVDATPSLTAAPDRVAASCICYTTSAGSSSFTTEIDDLASSCAPWAKTAARPTFYSAVVAFEDFCEMYSPTSTRTRTSSTTSTETDTETTDSSTPTPTQTGGFGGSGGTTTTRTFATPTTSAATTRATGMAAPAGAGGLVVWTAELFSFVLSFFLLV